MIFSRQINNISGNLLIFTLLFCTILFCSAGKSLKSQNRSNTTFSSIIIDAGHGGKDPGAVVGRACEKDIVLDIARRLGRIVKQGLPDVKVVYTRSGDYFVPLFKRSAIANKNNASLFISIHANFCESSSVKGTETYVLGPHRTQDNLDVAKKENSVVLLEEDYSRQYEGFDPNSPESEIMFELIQNNHIEQSVLFAGMVQDRFRQHAGRSDRDVRQAGFLVLRETAMPSVLIETGYLSNKAEAEYLMTEEGRETIAMAIFNSIKSYKSKFDSRLNFVSAEAKDSQVVKEKGKTVSQKESLSTEKETLAETRSVSSASTKKNKSTVSENKNAKTNTTKEGQEKQLALQESNSKEKESLADDKSLSSKSDKKTKSAQASNKKTIPEKGVSTKEEKDRPLSHQDSSSTEKSSDVKSVDPKPADKKSKSSLPAGKNTEKITTQKEKVKPEPTASAETSDFKSNDRNQKKIGKKESDSGKKAPEKEVSSKAEPDKKTAEVSTHAFERYSYAIQIAASKVKLSKAFYLFKGLQNIREVEIGGYFKYYSYESDSRKKTLENLAAVKSRIPDAFAVGMKDGLPVPITEVPRQLK